MIEIKLSEAINELKKLGAKKIFLQVPEGLKTRINSVIDELEKNGFEAITEMDPCFGACDIKPEEAKRLGCDAVLHLGHNSFVEKEEIIPIIYAPLKQKLKKDDLEKTLNALAVELVTKKIKVTGLVTTIQFIDYLPLIEKFLAEKGIRVFIGKGRRVLDGQVLGCNYSSAMDNGKAQVMIYFGEGLFHALGVHFSTGKEVIIANPTDAKVSELKEMKDAFLRKRITLIEQAKEAKSFGIIVSTKIGQNKISEAREIKKEIESRGKKANIYVMDFVSNNSLLGNNEEAYINTACPRISIDDNFNYKKPIINKNEVDYLLGKKSYENYKIEEVY